MKTDLSLLNEPPGPMKRLAATGANYYEGSDVIRALNRALGPDGWDWIEGERGFDELADEVFVVGTLLARFVVDDGDGGEKTVITSKTERGWKAVNRKRADDSFVSLGDDYKAADTDALKRCARLLGVGLDAWGGGARQQQPPQSRPPASSPRPIEPPPEPLSPAARAELTATYIDLLALASADGSFYPSWSKQDPAAWSDVQLQKYTSLVRAHVDRRASIAS